MKWTLKFPANGIKSWLIISLCLMLSACSTDLTQYKATSPTFDLFGYFAGKTHIKFSEQKKVDAKTSTFFNAERLTVYQSAQSLDRCSSLASSLSNALFRALEAQGRR